MAFCTSFLHPGIHSAAIGVEVKLEYLQVSCLLPKHLEKQAQPCLTDFHKWIHVTQDEVLIWQYWYCCW